MSALGGPDGKLTDFRGADSLSWSPDGHWLAAARSENVAGQPGGIYLIPAEGGDPRPLIAPTAGHAFLDPAFSPDGHRLAYGTCSRGGDEGPHRSRSADFADCDIYLMELDARGTPTQLPRRLTTQRSVGVDGITWTRDGTGVVYSAAPANFSMSYLWRVGVDGTRPPERLEIAGANAGSPATTRARDRLAFARASIDTDVYRVEAGHPSQLVVGSTFMEVEPRLSPDGRRLVFGSQRAADDLTTSGYPTADGSSPRRLTHGPGRGQASPSWSPDGRRIAFDSLGQDDQFHIWLIDADGGTPRRITTKADNEHVPTWSRDGRWVYFSSDEGTTRDIWRVPASGGTPERLTHGGSGPFACESADGKSLLFQTRRWRFAPDGNGPRRRPGPAARGVREEQRLWRRSRGGLLRAVRCQR